MEALTRSKCAANKQRRSRGGGAASGRRRVFGFSDPKESSTTSPTSKRENTGKMFHRLRHGQGHGKGGRRDSNFEYVVKWWIGKKPL
ncbi:hypothetical protein F2Q70_00022631 [Brassica cretica]|uniref:Uncharacterized protein n=1 Tax=Brassica cretica TaxID=69181 RepID=A0A8S9GET7_BRACR|nr:hypothetical protein F2Q70_00022631 [Brassica cretica]